jgi:TRAP-type C4-dicarboxylate transport system permease small subunit
MDKVLPFIGVLFITVGTISTFIGVMIRTFTTSSAFTWVDELTRYCMIWGTLLVIGITMRKGLMTAFTLLLENLPLKVVIIFKWIIHTLVISFYCLIFYYGLRMAIINEDQLSMTLQIKMFYPYLIMPVSAALIIYEGLTCMYEMWLEFEGKIEPGKTPELRRIDG